MRGAGLGFSAVVVAAACARTPRAGPPAAPAARADPGADVHGAVLDANSHLPLVGRSIFIGDARAVTDAEGRFMIPGVGRTYGVAIVSPHRSNVTLYTALAARDPILVADAEENEPPPAHSAELSGTLVGEYPHTSPDRVYFKARYATADLALGAPGSPAGGPAFGPLHVAWNGPDLLDGDVFARRFAPAGSGSEYCAHSAAALRAGEAANVKLEFEEAPVVRRPPVRLGYPASLIMMPRAFEEYRARGSLALNGNNASFERPYASVDLSGCGLTLCTMVSAYSPYLHSNAESCGAVSTDPVLLALRPAPVFSAPPRRSLARPGLEFTWSAIPHAVYELTLADYYDHPPPEATTIHVFTPNLDTIWPDLSAFGVAFPLAPKLYAAKVRAFGAYAGLDDLVSAAARAARAESESFASESEGLPLFVRGPIGKEEASCRYDEQLTCDMLMPPDGHSPPGGMHVSFALGGINATLRSQPEFANAVHIHCVSDCKEASAYASAYFAYRNAHPDTSLDTTLIEPDGPEPPPPPEFGEHLRARLPNANAPGPAVAAPGSAAAGVPGP